MEKFRALGLSEATLTTLEKRGFEEPTEIQEKTIPVLLTTQKDVIAQAQTGTGKTAAFGLAFVERLAPNAPAPQAVVLVPTRELALQVAEELNALKGQTNLRTVPIYGGQNIGLQFGRLKKGADIIIGTPGRVMDHLDRGTLDLSVVDYVVLDEADEMLNMGFVEDIEQILTSVNPARQMLLFSATMPPRIKSLARQFMPEYEFIQAEHNQLTTALVDQIYYEVRQGDKFEALCRIIDMETDFYGIIFCRTKVDVDFVSEKLSGRGYNAEALHGDIAQMQRERILKGFKDRTTRVLVATDVAARGIDVNNLTHVINFALPQNPESYVHRIGRTGRAGNQGTAITFITPAEFSRLSFIKKITGTNIRREKVPGTDEVIAFKQTRIRKDVADLVEAGGLDLYRDMAGQLLLNTDAADVVAALLKLSYADELDEDNYGDIKDMGRQAPGNGKVRLFLTTGKKDGMTPRKLADIIEQEVGIPSRMIDRIDIYDIYSFISVGLEDAETILAHFTKKGKGHSIVAERAAQGKNPPGQRFHQNKGGGYGFRPGHPGRSGGYKAGYSSKSKPPREKRQPWEPRRPRD